MKKILLLTSFIFVFVCLFSQNQKMWLLITAEQITYEGQKAQVIDNELLSLVGKHEKTSLPQAFPYSKNDTLKQLYEIDCKDSKLSQLKELQNRISELEDKKGGE
jgi:hypothetical protein